jgi:hypothetical protein
MSPSSLNQPAAWLTGGGDLDQDEQQLDLDVGVLGRTT